MAGPESWPGTFTSLNLLFLCAAAFFDIRLPGRLPCQQDALSLSTSTNIVDVSHSTTVRSTGELDEMEINLKFVDQLPITRFGSVGSGSSAYEYKSLRTGKYALTFGIDSASVVLEGARSYPVLLPLTPLSRYGRAL
jgi:hypothetical protein